MSQLCESETHQATGIPGQRIDEAKLDLGFA